MKVLGILLAVELVVEVVEEVEVVVDEVVVVVRERGEVALVVVATVEVAPLVLVVETIEVVGGVVVVVLDVPDLLSASAPAAKTMMIITITTAIVATLLIPTSELDLRILLNFLIFSRRFSLVKSYPLDAETANISWFLRESLFEESILGLSRQVLLL